MPAEQHNNDSQEQQVPSEPVKAPAQEIIDEILEGLPQWIRDPLVQHFRQIFAGIAIALLTMSLWSGYTIFIERGENAASAQLGGAIQTSDPKERADLLKKITEEHGNTDSGEHALLLLAAAYRDSGDMKNASKYFTQVIDTFPKASPLRDSAIMGLGYCMEDRGNPSEAAKKFRSVSDGNTGYEVVALLDLARVNAAAGDKKAALEAYDKFMAAEPMSSQLDFVRFEIMKLSGKSDS